MKPLTLLILAAGLVSAAEPTAEELLKKETAKLQGAWTAEMLLINGAKPEGDPTVRLIVKDNLLTFKVNDQVVIAGTAKLEPGLDPKLIDLVITQGEPKGQTWEGIYVLDGDTFKLCLMLKEKERPSEFTSKADSNTGLVVFKRDK